MFFSSKLTLLKNSAWISFILLNLLFFGCKSTVKDEDIVIADTISIDLHSVRDSTNISSLIENIQVIPLAEQKGFFIGDIYKILYDGNRFLIHDRFNNPQILLFDGNGKFNRQILSIGKGPQEALQIDDCWLNTDSSFDAYDSALKKVFHFDHTYHLQGTIRGGGNNYHNLIRINNSNAFLAYSTLTAFNRQHDNKNFNVEILNKNLEVENGLFPYSKNIEGASILTFNEQFRQWHDTIRFMRPYDPNIYNFNGPKIINRIALRYSENAINRAELEKIIVNNTKIFKNLTPSSLRKTTNILTSYSYYGGEWVEDSNCIIFSSISKKKPFITVYSKNKKKVIFHSRYLYEKKKYNMIIPPLISTGGGYFIGIINSMFLKYYLLGRSPLDQFTNLSYNSFLIVKIKLRTI